MGSFSVFMTFLLGVKFIVTPVMTTKEAMQGVSAKKRAVQSVVCGVLIGLICGFIGAGGGMMMLLILTSVLGYELKTAVGTSVFIMTFTALTGAVSHFTIGGAPDWTVFVLCVVFTLLWARIAAVFANKADAKTLNRATGIVLVRAGRRDHGLQPPEITPGKQQKRAPGYAGGAFQSVKKPARSQISEAAGRDPCVPPRNGIRIPTPVTSVTGLE